MAMRIDKNGGDDVTWKPPIKSEAKGKTLAFYMGNTDF